MVRFDPPGAERRLIAQVVLGKAQAERASSLELGETTAGLLRASPQLHDGRWLSILVRDAADVEDVERLLYVQVHPVEQRD